MQLLQPTRAIQNARERPLREAAHAYNAQQESKAVFPATRNQRIIDKRARGEESDDSSRGDPWETSELGTGATPGISPFTYLSPHRLNTIDWGPHRNQIREIELGQATNTELTEDYHNSGCFIWENIAVVYVSTLVDDNGVAFNIGIGEYQETYL